MPEYGKGFKVGQKVIFEMKFKGLNLRRFCVGKLTEVWTDIDWTPVEISEWVQTPEYNAFTWNNHPKVHYRDMVPYTDEIWHSIVVLVKQMNTTIKSLNDLKKLSFLIKKRVKVSESDVEVHIAIPCSDDDEGKKLHYILEAERNLKKAGVTFDTGLGFGYRDWEFDWSLKGAIITKIRERKPEIKMTITRPNDKSFTAIFKTKEDLINFKDFTEVLIKNAQKIAKGEKIE